MAPGKASIPASGVGDATGPGRRSSRSCSKSGNAKAAWATNCGLSMPPLFALAERLAGRKKNPGAVPSLGGPKAAQLKEPPKHALGYSRGGFGTKVNLLLSDRGVVLGIYVTPGQQHESTAFEPLMRRILVSRRRGISYWPAQLAGDKGYSYPHIRRWLKRHHIEPVIPTRKNQPREESFDKASYRQRNLIERVIGWYKECRALGTRYEKLAVDYVTLWMIAMIEKLLQSGRKSPPR
jgi:transposase